MSMPPIASRCNVSDVLCRRHNAIASHMEYGLPMCVGCFREALLEAVSEALERQIEAMRAYSVGDLVRRLEGRKHAQ